MLIWLIFWIAGIGLPIYLFKKYQITFHQKSWQHTLFFIFLIILLFAVYQHPYSAYFNNLPSYSLPLIFFLFLLFVSASYPNDYHTKQERFGYQLPKFFEIIFQQLCFLGGLLTFGVSPIIFGLIFFAVHTPFVFFVSKKFALFVTAGSLVGGVVFAYLQLLGVWGLMISLFVHLLFWHVFHYMLSTKNFLGIIPIKR